MRTIEQLSTVGSRVATVMGAWYCNATEEVMLWSVLMGGGGWRSWRKFSKMESCKMEKCTSVICARSISTIDNRSALLTAIVPSIASTIQHDMMCSQVGHFSLSMQTGDIYRMSAATEEEDKNAMICCACCGIAGVDDIKLKRCTACYLVRYCSVICQKTHRPKHKRECRKRAAELRDELLFKQPESNYRGDCPICFLPLPVEGSKSFITVCCSKMICIGCDFANQKREKEARLEPKCAFCRHPIPNDDEETKIVALRRAEANNPIAMFHVGLLCYKAGDYEAAFEYWTKVVNSGDICSKIFAHLELSVMYRYGHGVEKNRKKEIYHLEEAAIAGDPVARDRLGCIEEEDGRTHRAVKHWLIAANLGDDTALFNLKACRRNGLVHVSEGDFATALRAHKALVNETKSPQRDIAASLRGYKLRD